MLVMCCALVRAMEPPAYQFRFNVFMYAEEHRLNDSAQYRLRLACFNSIKSVILSRFDSALNHYCIQTLYRLVLKARFVNEIPEKHCQNGAKVVLDTRFHFSQAFNTI